MNNNQTMNTFDKVVSDILLKIGSLKYDDIDKNVIRTNIMINLFFFCKDESSFEKNYGLIGLFEEFSIDDNDENTNFNFVISDIISSIDNIKYSSSDKEIIKEKIKKTISMLCKNEKIFEKNIYKLKKEKSLELVY